MTAKAGHTIKTSGKIGETPDGVAEQPFQMLNDQVSQSLLAVRLLLTQAQEAEADRLEIIKRCDRYLNFALEDLRKLRDSTDRDPG
jgi:hypothetical protein